MGNSEVRTDTDTIATASSQIVAGNLDLSSRTEEQAMKLDEMVFVFKVASTQRSVAPRAIRRMPRKGAA